MYFGIFAFSLYALSAVFAASMTYQEHKKYRRGNTLWLFAGLLCCISWPISVPILFMPHFVRKRPKNKISA